MPATHRQLPAELGLEPPISADGAVMEQILKHRASPRWLISLILVGLFGSFLMYFSVLGALSPETSVAEQAVMTKGRDDRSGSGALIVVARRSDKLIRQANLMAARQDYRAPILVRAGSTEVARTAGFTRLSTVLATESLGFSDQVPAFNLSKLVSLASEDRVGQDLDLSGAQDSDISIAFRPLSQSFDREISAIRLGEEEATTQVVDFLSERRRDTSRIGAQSQLAQSQLAKVMRAPEEGTSLMAFTGAGVGDPFSKLVVRMVAENVTVIPRRDSVLTPFPTEDRILLSRSIASTQASLKAAGATPKQITEIIAALTRQGRANNLDGNRLLRFTLQTSEPGSAKELMRVELFFDEQLIASTGRRDDGTFWPIEQHDLPDNAKKSPGKEEEDEEEEVNSTRLTLFASIHETTRRYDIPPAIAEEIIRTVFFDVDLQRRVAPGDQLELLIGNGEGENARQDLLLVSLNSGGVKRRYFRFKLPDEDVVDFFDEQGRSVKQFLLRKPMDGGEFRSGFGMRRHPITRSYRLHAGVDWAGPVGLPIRAAGGGIIRMAEWDSGYGRRVEIEHNHGYVTTYNHMSAFANGIKAGVRVRQGQVIGRLGSSGLSTGPHLHYEVMINERFVDPLLIRLPRGRELAGNPLGDFKRERDFIESVVKRAPGANALVAQN